MLGSYAENSLPQEFPVVKVHEIDEIRDLSERTMAMFRHMWLHYPYKKWYMKVDDDTYVLVKNLLQVLTREVLWTHSLNPLSCSLPLEHSANLYSITA